MSSNSKQQQQPSHRDRAIIYTHSTIFEPLSSKDETNIYSTNRQQNILAQRSQLIKSPSDTTSAMKASGNLDVMEAKALRHEQLKSDIFGREKQQQSSGSSGVTSKSQENIDDKSGNNNIVWGMSEVYHRKQEGRCGWTNPKLQHLKENKVTSPRESTARHAPNKQLQAATEDWSHSFYSSVASKQSVREHNDRVQQSANDRKHVFLHGNDHNIPTVQEAKEMKKLEPDENSRRFKEKNFSDIQGLPSGVNSQKRSSNVITAAGTKWHESKTEIAHRNSTGNTADNKTAREKKLIHSNQSNILPASSPGLCQDENSKQEHSTAQEAYKNDSYLRPRRNSGNFDSQKVCTYQGSAFTNKIEIRRGEMRQGDKTKLNKEGGAKEMKMRQMMGSGVVSSFGNQSYTKTHHNRNLTNYDDKKSHPTHGYSKTLRSAQGVINMCPESSSENNPKNYNLMVSNNREGKRYAAECMESYERKAQDLKGQISNADF